MDTVDAMYKFAYAFVLLILLDLPWLYIQSTTSQSIIKKISGSFSIRLWAAIPVYVALAYLLMQQTSVKGAFLTGMSVYAVYDFTTLALFKDYPLSFAAIDTLWGGVLMSLAYSLLKYAFKRDPSIRQ
jgi:uncharacterized membrane protein